MHQARVAASITMITYSACRVWRRVNIVPTARGSIRKLKVKWYDFDVVNRCWPHVIHSRILVTESIHTTVGNTTGSYKLVNVVQGQCQKLYWRREVDTFMQVAWWTLLRKMRSRGQYPTLFFQFITTHSVVIQLPQWFILVLLLFAALAARIHGRRYTSMIPSMRSEASLFPSMLNWIFCMFATCPRARMMLLVQENSGARISSDWSVSNNSLLRIFRSRFV